MCAALERLEHRGDIFATADFECDDLKAERGRRCLNMAPLQRCDGIADIGQESQPADTRNHLTQQLESLASKIGCERREASDVAARSREAGDKSVPTGSPITADTMGMTAVACFAATTGGVA